VTGPRFRWQFPGEAASVDEETLAAGARHGLDERVTRLLAGRGVAGSAALDAFFGTPEFAAASLQALLDAGVDVPLVVTQPDRPVGRHAELRPSAVGALAASRGLPTEKPETLRANAGLVARLREARLDAIAVVAYGRILPSEILALPRLGCVNVHASLLPRWRGASPIQAAILAGDAETGVVTMRMEEGLDTGPVYLERRVAIGERETSGELSGRLQLLAIHRTHFHRCRLNIEFGSRPG